MRITFADTLLSSGSSHTLEALSISLVDFWNLVVVLLKLVNKLGSIELAVGATSLDDLGLLLKGKVLPLERWTNVLLEEGKNLVVGNGSWVGEVEDTSGVVLGKDNGGWKKIGKDGVGVWYVDDTLVLGDLGDEVTAVEIVGNWHPQSEDEAVLVVLEDLLGVSGDLAISLSNIHSRYMPWSRSRKIHRSWLGQSRGILVHRLGASRHMRRYSRWRRQCSGLPSRSRHRSS